MGLNLIIIWMDRKALSLRSTLIKLNILLDLARQLILGLKTHDPVNLITALNN